MWAPLFPGRRVEHVPIGHITNGVHVTSWLAPQMKRLYDRHLGSDWLARSSEPGLRRDRRSDDGELWETHQTLKAQLITVARRRAVHQAERRGESAEVIAALRRVLSPDTLTIGFARRFATYKRANLVLQDLEEVASLVNHPQCPCVIFAGRRIPACAVQGGSANPRAMRDPRFAGKISHRGLRHQRRPLICCRLDVC